ncbi:hypothetical protein EDC19_1865 [Natranaerovirga hydrolytica]|uniref:Sodium:proton antiporter n=1 Tax=Natranaerovirga hydrolytica TaxID=680378 RepID=A0A4R1MKX9_9FIRM|nr:SLC13 family permease [Natranaerovirga hydrolytica]TCK92710.1 hypothetical protein EDC19_1865 [Natranaerovirga hydrolytica]
MTLNPVVISVIVMIVLCLFKLNVILSLIIAALVGGTLAGFPLDETMGILIEGMSGNASTALSYILLGMLAAAIHKSGVARVLTKSIGRWIAGKGVVLVIILAVISSLSQNLIPVHIAFIPILIPPLIAVMNKLKIDRRAVATSLTFGLKAPYVALPFGYGWIFHGLISEHMTRNGMEIAQGDVWRSMWIAGFAMFVGLLVAIFITYRKPRDYEAIDIVDDSNITSFEDERITRRQFVALIGAVAAFGVQLSPLESLHIGALVGIAIMVVGGAIKWSDIDEMVNNGIGMMGYIAFVMLVAAGYAEVLDTTGGVHTLVETITGVIGQNQLIAATIMILIGLVITMGIGTSFGTISIIAVLYVPLATAVGFSPMATVLLIGTAAALGDAGSPASDSTLGPTAGLNVDGQHDHIWDTCVPTFLHYNIPLIIFGIIGAIML